MNVALVVEYVFEATFLPLDLETKQEDTESVASTVTSDISSKNQQSDSLQTKVKSKPIKTTASTSQSRLVNMRLQTECYTLIFLATTKTKINILFFMNFCVSHSLKRKS